MKCIRCDKNGDIADGGSMTDRGFACVHCVVKWIVGSREKTLVCSKPKPKESDDVRQTNVQKRDHRRNAMPVAGSKKGSTRSVAAVRGASLHTYQPRKASVFGTGGNGVADGSEG